MPESTTLKLSRFQEEYNVSEVRHDGYTVSVRFDDPDNTIFVFNPENTHGILHISVEEK